MRFFNKTGPCNPRDHYMLPPADRLQCAQLDRYVRDKLFWVLHAPRQTGKTTFLQSWMRELNARGDVLACYVSVEVCQRASTDDAMQIIYSALYDAARDVGFPAPIAKKRLPQTIVYDALVRFAECAAPKPLVVLFDEVDVLEEDAMIRFLRLLRKGFTTRGVGRFPVSVALVGMRDLRDYLTEAKDGVAPNPGSPFNIKEDSSVIGNFTREHIAALFAQRTEETGQGITDEALAYVWDQSRGQPWIVNSLFGRATMRVLAEDDFQTVTLAHVQEAREQIIQARETHLDSLNHRMSDPRVRFVMETLLSGSQSPDLLQTNAFHLCLDLGLVAMDEENAVSVSNPIYREVLSQHMTYGCQYMLPVRSEFKWQTENGTLDMDSLLREFQKFWRRHSEVWESKSDYTEAFPHLLLMAFLQRITNGGGRIEREFAAGRGRMDLLVEYEGKSFIIEIKILHDYDPPSLVLEEGLEQTRGYRDRMGKGIPCYLVLFDRRSEGKKAPWDERMYWKQEDDVTVVGA